MLAEKERILFPVQRGGRGRQKNHDIQGRIHFCPDCHGNMMFDVFKKHVEKCEMQADPELRKHIFPNKEDPDSDVKEFVVESYVITQYAENGGKRPVREWIIRSHGLLINHVTGATLVDPDVLVKRVSGMRRGSHVIKRKIKIDEKVLDKIVRKVTLRDETKAEYYKFVEESNEITFKTVNDHFVDPFEKKRTRRKTS